MLRCTASSLLLLSSTAFAQDLVAPTNTTVTDQDDWIGILIQSANGSSYGPLEDLIVEVPDHVPFETLPRLGLEVDAIDVTPLLAFENQRFNYRPPQALQPGQHQLRLIEVTLDGDVVERGSWDFTVSSEAAIADNGPDESDASISATNAVEFSQRLADKGFEDTPARGQVSGGGYADAAYSHGQWSVTNNANYLIETQKDRAVSGRGFDLGEYTFNTRFDDEDFFGQVALGHQSLNTDSFIMSNYSRRGLSASLGSGDELLSVTGFSFHPESVVGSENITGLNDSDNRLMGFQATAHPVPAWGKDFSVTGVYYSGKGTEGGVGIGGDSNTNQGDGWSVIAERLLFERSVKITGQFARSNFEQSGVVLGDDEVSGDAWSLALSYTPFQAEEIAGQYLNLTLGGRYERVDTFFSSLANSSLAADRDSLLLYSDLYWGNISANAQGLYQTNNVDDLSGLPTDSLLSLQFTGSYYPTIEPPAEDETDWLGQPYLNLNIGAVDNERVETPEDYFGGSTDNSHLSVTLGGGSSYGAWGWQISETFARFLDRTDASSDTKSYFTDVSANWTISDAVQLSGGVQWGLFTDTDADTRTHNVNVNLGVQAEILPETLRTSLNYNLNLLTGDGDTPDNTVANGEIEWTILPPTENNVGIALAFQGLLENKDGNGDTSIDGTDWQLFSVLRVSAPISY
ncbi:hypothetical protein [Pelagibius sp. Alg239-R121]|uniref:hypothetical protein n=1 Tax=Pelagibius sp. Alg239-R121 TaxID=2993448 RepID=UPI0024A72AB9|nr:hypothetical protein [Pelagibius sp. Alg239-R121]